MASKRRAGIAQLVEQRTENPRVTGSSPVPGIFKKTLKSLDFKVFCFISPEKKSQPQLDELCNKYSEFKKPQVSPSTYAKDFSKHRNHIAKLPTRSLNEASTIRDYLLSNLTPDAAKRCLTQLKACCNWAMDERLIDANPFAAMKIKVPKGAYEEQDIHPFSKEERGRKDSKLLLCLQHRLTQFLQRLIFR